MNRRILVLGPESGWHAEALRQSAVARGDSILWATYESLAAEFDLHGRHRVTVQESTESGSRHALADFHHVLARTMPHASLEQITFRLSTLHAAVDAGISVVNPPRTLELAIDKYHTLTVISSLGIPIPATRVVQSRREALDAFDELGGDVVTKPLFGGEGRGLMRISNRELAWYAFSTLDRLDSVLYLQAFVPPGGQDTRLLVVGDQVFGLRRKARDGWRTNVSQGGTCHAQEPLPEERSLALKIARAFGLQFGAVDLIDCEDGVPKVLEVNAVPGWKGAQQALGIDVAGALLDQLDRQPAECSP